MKKADIIVLVIILVAVVGLFGFNKYKRGYVEKNSSEIYVDIYANQELYKSIPLTDKLEEAIEIETALGKNIVKIHDGGVEMIEADCNDSICEKTGFINEVGQMIVCLPHEVLVEIRGDIYVEEKIDEVSN